MYFNVENRTDETISIVWQRENGEQQILVVEVSAGKWVPLHVNGYGGRTCVAMAGSWPSIRPAARSREAP
jgi:hypothetical protein